MSYDTAYNRAKYLEEIVGGGIAIGVFCFVWGVGGSFLTATGLGVVAGVLAWVFAYGSKT